MLPPFGGSAGVFAPGITAPGITATTEPGVLVPYASTPRWPVSRTTESLLGTGGEPAARAVVVATGLGQAAALLPGLEMPEYHPAPRWPNPSS